MKRSFYIMSDGEIKRKDNTFVFENDSGKKYIPIEELNDIYAFGELTLNKRFLEYASQKEVPIHFFNYYGYYIGSFYPREHLNSGYMILKQAEHYLDSTKRLFLARQFVVGSTQNILHVLKYYINRDKEMLNDTYYAINELIGRLEECADVSQLMAIEGNIRDLYYKAFDLILENPDFLFEKRTRRPPQNYINTMISFGNSIIYTIILSEIYKTHLDPRIGYLHSTNFRRFTLNLDVSEIFKPIIVDRMILTLIGKKMITKSDFDKDANGIIMKDKGKQLILQEIDKRMGVTIRHRELGREVSYRTIVRMELYKLEKHLMGEKEFKPFQAKW
ncbi:MAG: type I-B CRISPR-associated endonuclease Cas1b [Thermoanaerobacteraceae bacterium]|nr:type I-B CRISPR-associated endonuclease Cas1b [Thermoanaerobacteraceae bacterium]